MRVIRATHAFDGSRFLTGGAIVVLDRDRITGVHTGHIDLPEDIDVEEYDGTVLPGLFDCHTHLAADSTFGGLERVGGMAQDAIDAVIEQSLRAHAQAGVTTVRDLGDRGYRTLSYRSRPGLPRVIAAGPPLTTPHGHCHFLGGAVTGDLGSVVAEHAERGVDVVKIMASGGFATPNTDQLGAQFSVPELIELVEAAHRLGLPVVAHAHSLIGMQNVLAAGVDGIEHFTGLSSAGATIDDELLDEVARGGVVVDLTMGNDRSYHALMPTPPPAFAALMARMGVRTFDEFYMSRFGVLSRLREHGAVVITGVDSGMGPFKRHGSAWRVVEEMIMAGYPAAEALAAATSVSARVCGVDEETGRLADGYAADLLLVPGDLSVDMSGLSAPQEVLIRGERVPLDSDRVS